MTTRVAAIDCGTNSIRLLVADLPNPGAGPAAPLVELSRRLETVRLGQGVDRTGRLAPEAIERTRVALAEYAAEIEKSGAERVRMCATSASRDAENAADFRDMVERTLGVAPEVVTGEEEARLSFTGAVHGLPAATREPYLVVDIGGGSTEFVVGTDFRDMAQRIQHARVSYRAVADTTADLLAATRAQRLAIPVMHPGRADVIAAGALVLRVIMERAGMDSVVASEHDILDGICYSLR